MGYFRVNWKEDGDCTVLGRVTARNGSGAATGIDGEGNFVQQADVSSILFKIFDLDSDDPTTATNGSGAGESLTVSSIILDTVVTTNVIWTKDETGYNFLHDIAASYFPHPNREYEVEYKFTLSGGAIFHGVYTGLTIPVRGS